MKHWVEEKNKEVELPTEAFFLEIESVCRKYGVSVSHEAEWAGFVIEEFRSENLDWLRGGSFTTAGVRSIRKAMRARNP